MRLLLATNHLYGWTGSEITLATLCHVLREAGHEVLAFAPFVASDAVAHAVLEGTGWTDDLATAVAFAPQAAYTQHHPVALQLRVAMPGLPIAHALLGVLPHLEQPPPLDLGLSMLLPISEEVARAARLAQPARTPWQVFRNLVDDSRFDDDAAGERPLRRLALVSYKLDQPRQTLIRAVAARRGLVVADHQPVRPGIDSYADMPARVRDGEIVIASGRGAIEAMLCGRVPLIMANCGDDGLVTPDNFDTLMAFNFSGRASGQALDEDGFARALDRYTPQLGRQLQALARQHLGLAARRTSVLSMFEALVASSAPELGDEHVERLRFHAETARQQRQFASRTDAMRREAMLGHGSLGWTSLLAAGHAAWRSGDATLAFEAYLKAFQAPGDAAAPAHSLASNLLVQLASREKRGANPAGQRAALEAFLRLNPANAWALQQLEALSGAPPRTPGPS